MSNPTSLRVAATLALALLSNPLHALEELLPAGHTWEYTFSNPTADPTWNTATGGWPTGPAPFGSASGGGVNGVTDFNFATFWPASSGGGDDLWLRTAIDLNGIDRQSLSWVLGVDNGYKLYVNGTLVSQANAEGYTYRWEYGGSISPALLNPGINHIAVALEDHGGATAFDMMITGEAQLDLTATMTPIQSVFNPNTDHLVANKDMMVRVEAWLNQLGGDPLPIDARLCVTDVDPGCQLAKTTSGLVYPLGTTFTEAEALSGDDALHLRIAGALSDRLVAGADGQPASHRFELELSSPTGAFSPLTLTRELTFRQSETFRVFSMPYGYKPSGGEETYPGTEQPKQTHRLLQSIYPLDEELIENIVMPTLKWDPDNPDFPPKGDPNSTVLPPRFFDLTNFTVLGGGTVLSVDVELRKKQAMLLLGYEFENNLGVGILPSLANGDSPLSAYPSLGELLGVAFRGRDSVLVVEKNSDGEPMVQVVATHELGHTFGLKEEYCNDLFGFCTPTTPNGPPQSNEAGDGLGNYVTRAMLAYDIRPIGGQAVVPGRVRVLSTESHRIYGYMGAPSGGLGHVWTGPVEYHHLFGQLTSPPVGQSVRLQDAGTDGQWSQAIEARPVSVVAGQIGQAGIGTIDGLFSAPSSAPLPVVAGSGYALAYRDAAGNLLDETPFGVEFGINVIGSLGIDQIDTGSAIYSLLVELPPGTAAIGLYQDGVTEPLAERIASAHPPLISFTGLSLIDPLNAQVSWQGSDPDGDPLLYGLVYSPDGETRRLILQGSLERSTTLALVDAPDAPLAPGAYLELSAHDGFHVSRVRQPLLDATEVDVLDLVRYNPHGPNLSGFCSRRECAQSKRHSLTVVNRLPDQPVSADLKIWVDALPHSSCHVNGVGAGGAIEVGSGLAIAPSGRLRADIELLFSCDPAAAAEVSGSFSLRASAQTLSFVDRVPGNNELSRSQAVH